jgi:hypothetical protein
MTAMNVVLSLGGWDAQDDCPAGAAHDLGAVRPGRLADHLLRARISPDIRALGRGEIVLTDAMGCRVDPRRVAATN